MGLKGARTGPSSILWATTAPENSPSHLRSPRYWPSWLGVGVMKLVALLPYRALCALGRLLGTLTRQLPGERRRIAQRNLAICVPELAERGAQQPVAPRVVE